MDLLAPLNQISDIENCADAGAGEVYFGFWDDRWQEQFGQYADINRMSGFGKRANSISVYETEDAIREVHRHGMKVFITLNAPHYSSEELLYMERFFCMFEETKPDGVIISELAAARMAARHGISAVASTMCGIFNSDIASSYVREGIERIILPREMSLQEIQAIVKELPEIQFEIFLMRNGCVFSDSHCLGMHSREYGSLCGAIRRGPFAIIGDKRDFETMHGIEWSSMLFNEGFRQYACGLCAIYRLLNMGISAAKIVGRADDPKKVAEDIRLARDNIEIAARSKSEEEYLSNMKFPREHYRMCKHGLSCYYPEVRFGS